MEITKNIKFVGVNDHKIDLFEGQYSVPNGMSYNSYVILDDKPAIIDTVDAAFGEEWLNNLKSALGDKTPTYLIVEHMELDHSANIDKLVSAYPNITVVSTLQASMMMKQTFGKEFPNKLIVSNGDTLSLGNHELMFVAAPLVHWPEVTFVYEKTEKILFSADAFGKFGALDAQEDWTSEAKRYYFGIVGKFGVHVQSVLKKLDGLEISKICPLHGPVLSDNLAYYLEKYNTWSSYGSDTQGVLVAYTSVYGNTKAAAELLAENLNKRGTNVKIVDLARCDLAEAIADAFGFERLVLATTTYNNGIFPAMRHFVDELIERNFQNKKIAIIENGTWAPMASKTLKSMLDGCKNIEFIAPEIKIMSTLSEQNVQDIKTLADALSI